MKTIFTLAILLNIFNIEAQILSPSFETWENPLPHKTIDANVTMSGITFYICYDDFDYNELEYWSSTNQLTEGTSIGNYQLVTESADAVDGTKSVIIENKELDIEVYLFPGCFGSPTTVTRPIPGLIVNGVFDIEVQTLLDDIVGGAGLNALNPFNYPGVGEAINYIPQTISGQYKYTGGVDGSEVDTCLVVSGYKKNGVIIGYAFGKYANTTGWTNFDLTYTHLSCEIPDTIITMFTASNLDIEFIDGTFTINSNYTGVPNSEMFIDDIQMTSILQADLPPILQDDNDDIIANEVSVVDVLANDLFCDGVALAPVLDYTGIEGTAVVNAFNQIEFTPTIGFDGLVEIDYYTCNAVYCDTATISIMVEAYICKANDDLATMDANTSITKDVLLNDEKCGSVYSIIKNPSHGVANIESNNHLTYSPDNSFDGKDTLKYRICSDYQVTQCDTALVIYTILYTGINEIANDLIDFFPNPAKDVLNISVDVNTLITVKIFNTIGRTIIEESFKQTKQIELSKLKNGIYFVEIETNGKKSIKKLQIIK